MLDVQLPFSTLLLEALTSTQTVKSESLHRIGVLNGLRGYCALGVFFYHIFENKFPFIDGFGSSCVTFFFILSGFVLFLPFAQGIKTMTSTQDYWNFIVRRCQRLLPLYYFFLSIRFITMLTQEPLYSVFDKMKYAVTFTNMFSIERWMLCHVGACHFWSLTLEFWFSIFCFPILVAVWKRYSPFYGFLFTSLFSLTVRYLGVYLAYGRVLWGTLSFFFPLGYTYNLFIN